MNERGKAAWTLALLSTALAELVTASTLPLAFYNPVFFLLLLGMYGGGVLLVREFLVRLNKGPASLLALGLAYAILEEALILRSWFDPNYPNVQGLGWYGRVAGINTLWALWVTPLLALIANAIPIFFTSLLFPNLNGTPLLSKRQLAFPCASLAAVAGVTRILPQTYVTGPLEYGLAVALALALVAIAFRLPRDLYRPRAAAPPRRAWPLLLFGGVWTAFDFFLYQLGPAVGYHPMFSVVLMLAAPAFVGLALPSLLHPATWRQQLYLFFAGVMGFFAVMDLLRGLTSGPVGLTVVGAGFLIAARLLYREVWPSQSSGQEGPAPKSAA